MSKKSPLKLAVQDNRDGAKAANACPGAKEIRAARNHDRHPVTRPHALIMEHARHPRGGIIEFTIRKCAAADHRHDRLILKTGRPLPDDGWENPSLCL